MALRCVDHRKLLYASDYPLRLYPRRQPEPDFRPFLAEIAALDLPADVRADILGGNAARLLGPNPPTPFAAKEGGGAPSSLQPGERTGGEVSVAAAISAAMSTSAVAAAWPETRAIFARHGIPCEDSPIPFWEPISQAAAARGLGPDKLARLVAELNEAIGVELARPSSSKNVTIAPGGP